MQKAILFPIPLLILAACVGDEATPERAADAERIEGLAVRLRRPTERSWPASSPHAKSASRSSASGESYAIRSEDFELLIDGDQISTKWTPVLELGGDAFFLQHGGADRMELQARSQRFTPSQWLTDLALVAWHRPAGSRHQWRTVTGGPGYDEGLAHLNPTEVAHFRSPMYVDFARRGLSFPIDGAWGWLSFEEAGISEDAPELLVTVLPTYDPGSLADVYEWTIEAKCGSGLCPATDHETARDQSWGSVFPGEPWIGVSIEDAGSQLRSFLGLEKGVRILQPFAGSPASQAGVLAGDVISAADGTPVDPAGLRAATARAGVGAVVSLDVHRRGGARPIVLRATVQAAPDRRTTP